MNQLKWLLRLYLPFLLFYLLCGLILGLFIFGLNLFNIGDSLQTKLDYTLAWGSLVLTYLIVGITYLYGYIKKVIIPMHPNNPKQQRKTLHTAGFGLYVTCLLCFIGFLISGTYLDDMSFVSFFLGTLGAFIGSLLYLIVGPRFLQKQQSTQSGKENDISN